MPYVAKIKRDDPFRPDDEREIEAMCRRIAAAGEFMVLAGWRENAGFRVFHFPTWAMARAMKHWIDRSGIAGRPMPKLGETPEERAEQQREASAWGLTTGAVRASLRHSMRQPMPRWPMAGSWTGSMTLRCSSSHASARPSQSTWQTISLIRDLYLDAR